MSSTVAAKEKNLFNPSTGNGKRLNGRVRPFKSDIKTGVQTNCFRTTRLLLEFLLLNLRFTDSADFCLNGGGHRPNGRYQFRPVESSVGMA
jgi:hypothetical protein